MATIAVSGEPRDPAGHGDPHPGQFRLARRVDHGHRAGPDLIQVGCRQAKSGR
jgi:hypothetical protein